MPYIGIASNDRDEKALKEMSTGNLATAEEVDEEDQIVEILC